MIKELRRFYNDLLEEIAQQKPRDRFVNAYLFCMLFYLSTTAFFITLGVLVPDFLLPIYAIATVLIPLGSTLYIAFDLGQRFENIDNIRRGVKYEERKEN
ncbi:MAG: hypothetical protein ACP6IS_11220 [Candidatus Asgardarchaeia archaeon]